MKKSYTKKSVSMLFALCFLAAFGAFCFADYPSEITSEISFENYFSEPEVNLPDGEIPSVLAGGILNAKVYADFGDCSSANAYLEYNFDGSNNFATVTKENINRLKKMCEEYGVDSTKVYTQEQFLLKCEEWFRKKEEKKSRWGRL